MSDTCAQDASQDKSGPKLLSLLQAASPRWKTSGITICSDDVWEIQKHVRGWINEGYHLVVTSGGTGFAPRDVTPEAIEPLLEKRAPGLVHAMFAASFVITPLAAMARLVAGVAKKTIIVTVPGSPKGAKENLEAIIKMLPHACDLASNTVQSRAVHAAGTASIEEQAGIVPSIVKDTNSGHQCHGYHEEESEERPTTNDPQAPVATRQRHSPWPMISVDQAHKIIAEQITKDHLTRGSLSMWSNLPGAILAQDLIAEEDVPAFRASIVDGYAVRAEDGKGRYTLAGVSHAGDASGQKVKGKVAVRITTGAPVPDGADAVVMVEDTQVLETSASGEEIVVEILKDVEIFENVRAVGSDLKEGTILLREGSQITKSGGDVALAALSKLPGGGGLDVWMGPRIGVMSTGNELVSHGAGPLQNGQVRDTNRIALLGVIEGHGFKAIDLGIVKDDSKTLIQALRRAVDECDIIITTGGVSMGEMDLLKPTIERNLSGTLHFGRVAMKPGKPTTFATIPSSRKHGKTLVFALPGNPASALVTCHLFVMPAIRRMANYPESKIHHPRVPITLDGPVPLDPRPEFHRINVSVTKQGTFRARSTGNQRSSRVASLVCNGFLCLPASDDRKKELVAGDTVQAILCSDLEFE